MLVPLYIKRVPVLKTHICTSALICENNCFLHRRQKEVHYLQKFWNYFKIHFGEKILFFCVIEVCRFYSEARLCYI